MSWSRSSASSAGPPSESIAPDQVAPSSGLPPGAMFVGGRYWFHGGVWYQPWGSSFRVIVPPIGIVVPILMGTVRVM